MGRWETQLVGTQNSVLQDTTHEPDWRLSILQQLNSTKELAHINTQEELGLTNFDTETYFATEDGLKYQLPNGEVKMCITKRDAIDWLKQIHEYQVPPLTKEEILTEVHKGPYWWPTIPQDMEHVIVNRTTCRDTMLPDLTIESYGTILRKKRSRDWREPIIQHLKNPMELSNFAFHEELGVLRA